jgi:hypothetical protein
MATMSEYLMKDLAISVRGKLGPQQHSQVHCSIDDGIGLNDAEISLAINWLKCGDPSFFSKREKNSRAFVSDLSRSSCNRDGRWVFFFFSPKRSVEIDTLP